MDIKSFHANTPQQIAKAIESVQGAGKTVNLAIVFAALDREDLLGVQEVFAEAGIRVCGASATGQIANGGLSETGVSGLLVSAPQRAFSVWTGLAGEVENQASELGRAAVATFSNPSVFVLSGGIAVDGEAIIQQVNAGAGKPLALFGGLAGAPGASLQPNTFVFDELHCADPGLAAVIFDADCIELECHTTSGWEPMGIEHEITRAAGNVIHEINGQPALDFFEASFAQVGSGHVGIDIFNSQYPLQIVRPEGSVLRMPVAACAEDRAVTLAGGVQAGDRFRFSIAPGLQVIDETVAYFGDKRQHSALPDGVLMVSCAGRYAAFGPMLEDEIAQVHDVFGVPMAGYLSYGEIGSIEGSESAFHNDTCCMITLRAR